MILIELIAYISTFFCVIFFIYILVYKSYSFSTSKITTPDQALQFLLKGNNQYNSFWNFTRRANRKSVSIIQRPFAVILSCSDSRVPTEIIFNQLNLGNLFIIRNAGNVVDGVVLGSIEYGIDQLGAVLLIVLGHERCGAITATVDHILENKPESACHVKDIINAISPAAYEVLEDNKISGQISDTTKADIIEQVVKKNVALVVQTLSEKSTIIKKAYESNKIKIVGAFYDLGNGQVNIIS